MPTIVDEASRTPNERITQCPTADDARTATVTT